MPIQLLIPGTRVMFRTTCESCNREFFCDLPTGHSLDAPLLLEAETGEIYGNITAAAFVENLRDDYELRRRDHSVAVTVERLRPVTNGLLLNCLDWLYGHSLLKLLNAQFFLDHHREMDLIVIVPHHLRWLVPDGTAEIWTIKWQWEYGRAWNGELARQLSAVGAEAGRLLLAPAIPHPHPSNVDIYRFTRQHRRKEPSRDATVTIIWRDDRAWLGRASDTFLHRLIRRLSRTLLTAAQKVAWKRYVKLLRRKLLNVDIAVVGLSKRSRQHWGVSDLRTTDTTQQTEESWCARYAQSDIVVGVHGSNMILPSAHAGSVVELLPRDRWSNAVQDLFVAQNDAREALLLHRLLPLGTSPTELVEVTVSLLQDRQAMMHRLSASQTRRPETQTTEA